MLLSPDEEEQLRLEEGRGHSEQAGWDEIKNTGMEMFRHISRQ